MGHSTHDIASDSTETAVLVSLVTREGNGWPEMADYSLAELKRLAETAGLVVVQTVKQTRESPDPKWLIGKGKVEEVRIMTETYGANTVVFDQELSGSQVRNLEEALGVKVLDRTQLILDIFAQRAKTREGMLQVELAQLNYLLPRLSGLGNQLSRLGGGIGTRGPGESKLETDRRHIRRRIAELKRQLDEVIRTRDLQRQRRKRSGVFQIALVGYTNAGKSTLMRGLTRADVLAEDKLFATLDPTSRELGLAGGKNVILTDTVGFIQNLPHDLVAAFRSTLEEVCEADLILHVVDSSVSMRDAQMRVVQEVLAELGAHRIEQVTVFNKIDLCSESERDLLTAPGDYIRMSALNPQDLERLRNLLWKKLTTGRRIYRIPATEGEWIAAAYRHGRVISNETDGDHVLLEVEWSAREYDKWGKALAAFEPDRDGFNDKGRE